MIGQKALTGSAVWKELAHKVLNWINWVTNMLKIEC